MLRRHENGADIVPKRRGSISVLDWKKEIATCGYGFGFMEFGGFGCIARAD